MNLPHYNVGDEVLLEVMTHMQTHKDCEYCWQGTLGAKNGERMVCPKCHGAGRLKSITPLKKKVPALVTGIRQVKRFGGHYYEYQLDGFNWYIKGQLYDRDSA